MTTNNIVVAQFIGRPDKSGNYERKEMNKIKNIRLKFYDYSTNGHYFVTICTHYQKPHLTGHNKDVVAKFIEQKSRNIPGVNVDYYVVMPTHLHLILILDDYKLNLKRIIRRLKATTSKETGIKLWQPNYYEHVIRNEKALKKIREYITNNPAARRIKLESIYSPDKSGNYNE